MKGQEAVEVTFRYNLNGILEVTARSVSSGEEMSITLQDALNRNNRREFEESVQRLQELWENVPQASEDDENLEDASLFDPEDWDLLSDIPGDLDELDENWDVSEDDEAPTMLHEDGKLLMQQARKTLAGMESGQQAKLIDTIQELEQALQEEDVDKLKHVMERVTDLLIDAEF